MQINRGDMLAYAESYVAEDFYMQQARKNGAEVGAIDPTAAVGSSHGTCASRSGIAHRQLNRPHHALISRFWQTH